jgi:hypothetical protein
MQCIHAKHNLLEAAGRHHPHENAIDRRQVNPTRLDGRPPAANPRLDPGKRGRIEPDGQAPRRPSQVSHMPAGTRDERNDVFHDPAALQSRTLLIR